MITLTRVNNTPTRHNTYWPFATDEFLRPFAEFMNSPIRTGIRETETAYLFDAELPGYEASEIDLSIHEGVLTLSAEHKEDGENQPAFASRSLRRSFTIENVEEDQISAQYKNGILRVTLPKRKEAEAPAPRKIEIQ